MEKKKTRSRSSGKQSSAGARLIRKDVLIWSSACIMLSFWTFCLGVLVGRGNAPVRFDTQELQEELAALKKAAQEKTMRRYADDSQNADKRTSLAFFEELKRPRDTTRSPVGGDGAVKRKPSPAKIPMKVKGEAFKKPKKLARKRTTPVKLPAKQVGIAAKSASKPRGTWSVQVAATKDLADANRIVGRLKQKGYAAYRVPGDLKDKGVWHRVRVGRNQRRSTADAVMVRLKKDGYSPMLIKGKK